MTDYWLYMKLTGREIRDGVTRGEYNIGDLSINDFEPDQVYGIWYTSNESVFKQHSVDSKLYVEWKSLGLI